MNSLPSQILNVGQSLSVAIFSMKLLFIFFWVFILVIAAILLWNNHKIGNRETVYITEKAGIKYFELVAERKGLGHDAVSIFFPEHYNERFLLPINLFRNDTLLGNYITVKPGYYKYLGKVIKKEKNLIVDLYYDNTDIKEIEKTEWNGKYKILSVK